MTIEDIQQEIIDEFAFLEDWEERYEYMISLGKTLPQIDAQYKTEKYLIKGCQSRVWVHPDYCDGKVVFTADSDAIITKGIVALLVRVFSNQPPEAIVNAKVDFIDQIGLKEHLSPTRANGLVAMVKQLKMYALAYQTQAQN